MINFKKLGLTATVIFSLLVGSCSSNDEKEILNDNLSNKIPTEALTVEYYQYLFKNSPIADRAEISSVGKISDNKYNYFELLNNNMQLDRKDSVIKIELLLDNKIKTIYVLPLVGGKSALSYIEDSNNKIVSDPILFNLEANGFYNYKTVQQGFGLSRKDNNVAMAGCTAGADKIIRLGTAFAGLGLVGCVPCTFSGGAIVAITAGMSFFCKD